MLNGKHFVGDQCTLCGGPMFMPEGFIGRFIEFEYGFLKHAYVYVFTELCIESLIIIIHRQCLC